MSSNHDPRPPSGTSHKPPSQTPSIHGSETDAAQADMVRPTTSTRQLSTHNSRREYGTIGAAESGSIRRRMQPLVRAPTSPSVKRQDTMERPSSPELPLLSPQTSRTRPRPSTLRRQSSIKPNLPHRGQRFSVDDDVSEIEEDHEDDRDREEAKRDFTPVARTSTLRKRTIRVPNLARVDSADEDTDGPELERVDTHQSQQEDEDTHHDRGDHDTDSLAAAEDEDEDSTLSDAESFTLKDRQLAINETHPFGIRIWKPALYKKDRSVEKNADEDIHSSPSQIVGTWLKVFNSLWTIFFGWWLAALCMLAAGLTMLCSFEASASEYARTFWGLAGYLLWPFGQFVKLEQDDNYAEEDEGEGRSISEYERWQTGDLDYGRLMFGPSVAYVGPIIGRHRDSIGSADENDSLLGRTSRPEHSETTTTTRKRRMFGRGQWTLGRIAFFGLFYFLIAPTMLLVSGICWFLVFFIPMGRVLTILLHHIRMRPLALTFHPDASYARVGSKPSSIILCTYRAAGLKYWKYTVDGTNIFLINFCSIVGFVIIDYFLVKEVLGVDSWLTNAGLLFCLGLLSIIPLAYFIGQAVASISAQSTMGVGAVINAFFSTLVEVFLYCVALNQGKGRLVEGSIIGSIFAGILLLPGLSMCAGAINRKTQRFNIKSSTATSTLLLFAMIAQFGPTLFYKIYGAHELICKSCSNDYDSSQPRDCRECYFRQVPAPNDDFFQKAVRPYTWFAAVLLFLSYAIGLLFTLRTHAAMIWYTDLDEKKPQLTTNVHTANTSPSDTRYQSAIAQQALNMANSSKMAPAIRDSQMYKRVVNKTLQSAGIASQENVSDLNTTTIEDSALSHDYANNNAQRSVPRMAGISTPTSPRAQPTAVAPLPSLSTEENQLLLRQVAELASTAATVATRDALRHPQAASYMSTHSSIKQDKRRPSQGVRLDTMFHAGAINDAAAAAQVPVTNIEAEHTTGGHDAPNWSRTKSTVILLVATCAYAAIAEVLVDTVDVILSSVDIDEKFLGMTLFALIPNTTEFLNAISFAMNGNVALSMEIGAAYVLQVALLQIPALVLYSSVFEQFRAGSFTGEIADFTFNLIFPQWDMVTVILCVFLLSYVNSEGKSNYFKGSVLVLTYLVIMLGFYYSGFTGIDVLGVDPNDTLALTVSNWESLRRINGGGGGGGGSRTGLRHEL